MCYIYKTEDDAYRATIHKRFDDDAHFLGWDVDLWFRDPDGNHECTVASGLTADLFETRRAAKVWVLEEVNHQYLISINPKNLVIDGWEPRA